MGSWCSCFNNNGEDSLSDDDEIEAVIRQQNDNAQKQLGHLDPTAFILNDFNHNFKVTSSQQRVLMMLLESQRENSEEEERKDESRLGRRRRSIKSPAMMPPLLPSKRKSPMVVMKSKTKSRMTSPIVELNQIRSVPRIDILHDPSPMGSDSQQESISSTKPNFTKSTTSKSRLKRDGLLDDSFVKYIPQHNIITPAISNNNINGNNSSMPTSSSPFGRKKTKTLNQPSIIRTMKSKSKSKRLKIKKFRTKRKTLVDDNDDKNQMDNNFNF